MIVRSAENQEPFRASCSMPHDDLTSWLMTILLITAVFVLACVYDPATEPTLTLCLFRKWTGLPCPGCGITRSFCALGKGHWQESFSFHPLGPAIFFLFAAAWIRALLLLLSYALASRQMSSTVRMIVRRVDQLTQRLHLFQLGFLLLLSVWGVRLLVYTYSGKFDQFFQEGLLSKSLWLLRSLSGLK